MVDGEESQGQQGFDFIGLNTEIEEFGRKHRISQRTIYRIQAYVEEMCVQIILPQLDDPFSVLLTIEYSEEQDRAEVVIRYSGDRFDPTQTENELSLLLARKAAEEIVYREDPNGELQNMVKARI